MEVLLIVKVKLLFLDFPLTFLPTSLTPSKKGWMMSVKSSVVSNSPESCSSCSFCCNDWSQITSV